MYTFYENFKNHYLIDNDESTSSIDNAHTPRLFNLFTLSLMSSTNNISLKSQLLAF